MAVTFQRAPIVSGNANNGANAGFSYVNSNNAASNTNANISSQLCFLKSWECQAMALAKKSRCINVVLVG